MAFAAIEQPATFAERLVLARRIRDELEIPLPIFVDGMDDASRALFSDLPSPAFVIDREGRIVDKLPWADPELLQETLARMLAAVPQPEDPTAAWTLDERDAMARRLLAAGKPAAARLWLDTKSDPAPSVPPTLVATARAAITRVHAMRGAEPAAIAAAITTAHEHAAQVWADDPARLTAARAELAAAAADGATAKATWQAAIAGLEVRAPAAVRAWLEQQLAKVAVETRESTK